MARRGCTSWPMPSLSGRVFGGSRIAVRPALRQPAQCRRASAACRPGPGATALALPSCGHVLRWHENIPLLSWLRLRGRCSACRHAISVRYPLIELPRAALFAACGWRFGAQRSTLLWCAFVASLVALAWIDWDTTRAARRHHAAAAVGRAAGCRAGLDDAADQRAVGRRGAATCRCGRLLALQAGHRQGRHGLRRLQAAGRIGRLAGLASRCCRSCSVLR